MDGSPKQPLPVGVIVTVAVTEVSPLLMAVNEGMSPVPEAGKPIVLLSLVQVNEVPATVLLNETNPVPDPLQICWLAGCANTGVGSTINIRVLTGPWQPSAVAKTDIAAVSGTFE